MSFLKDNAKSLEDIMSFLFAKARSLRDNAKSLGDITSFLFAKARSLRDKVRNLGDIAGFPIDKTRNLTDIAGFLLLDCWNLVFVHLMRLLVVPPRNDNTVRGSLSFKF